MQANGVVAFYAANSVGDDIEVLFFCFYIWRRGEWELNVMNLRFGASGV